MLWKLGWNTSCGGVNTISLVLLADDTPAPSRKMPISSDVHVMYEVRLVELAGRRLV